MTKLTDRFSEMHIISEYFVPFVVRTLLGVFLGFMLAAICYVIAWAIVISFFEVTSNTFRTMAILGIGVGAGVGGSLGWINLEATKARFLVLLAFAILGAWGGAWGGMQYGGTVFIAAGMPGIGELSGLLRGAVIGSNLVALTVSGIIGLRIVRERRRATDDSPIDSSQLSHH